MLACALLGHVYAFKLETSLQAIATIETEMQTHLDKLYPLDAEILPHLNDQGVRTEEEQQALDTLNRDRDTILYKLQALVVEAKAHFLSLTAIGIFAPTTPVAEDDGSYEFTMAQRVIKEHSLAMLELTKSYLLPGLYGVLGALAYVMRTHQASRRRNSLLDTTGDYFARIILGLVAGVAIGLFLKPEPMNGTAETASIAMLTPVALAFLAGYAVELLFNVMDRLVTAFSGTAPARAGQ